MLLSTAFCALRELPSVLAKSVILSSFCPINNHFANPSKLPLWIDWMIRYGLLIMTIDAIRTTHHITKVRTVCRIVCIRFFICIFAQARDDMEMIDQIISRGTNASALINSYVNNTCIFARTAITISHSPIASPLLIHKAITNNTNTTTSINAVGLETTARPKNNHDSQT